MAKTQLNVRVDESTAQAARDRAQQRGMSVNRYIEELVRQDAGEAGRTFVEAAADFMKRYAAVFAEDPGDGVAASTKDVQGFEEPPSDRRPTTGSDPHPRPTTPGSAATRTPTGYGPTADEGTR
ncbi:toxin-antitoxin system HicB family antitoxin [Streptomyces sp. NPDC005963]|uniref:toxin-antitoxin system HicB family antitoxin n=1 Tax=Streptomyces sp. NPDC005963 TaxID=3156721 RepID=UPI0033C33D58